MFFIYYSLCPFSFPSFPTRRSSDLAVAVVDRLFEGEIAGNNPVGLEDEVVGAAHQDRKSTRLNSSHRCISYAVFCLKKKNWPDNHRPRRAGPLPCVVFRSCRSKTRY